MTRIKGDWTLGNRFIINEATINGVSYAVTSDSVIIEVTGTPYRMRFPFESQVQNHSII